MIQDAQFFNIQVAKQKHGDPLASFLSYTVEPHIMDVYLREIGIHGVESNLLVVQI